MGDRFRLADAKLDDQDPAGREQGGGRRGDGAIEIEPIGSAIEREMGIEIAHV
jgi:hypothetical protein